MAKDKFKDLDGDFKDSVQGMDEAEIRAKISQVALNQVELLQAKEKDQDLERAKAEAKDAGAIYAEGTKQNSLRIMFCKQVLEGRGLATSEPSDD